MADSPAQVAQAVEAAAATAGAIAGAQAAEVTASAEAAVAVAEERAEVAEAARDAIADAASRDILHRKVDEVAEDLDEWEGEVNNRLATLEAALSEIATRQQSLTTQMAEVIARLTAPAVAIPTNGSSSAPPPSVTPPAGVVIVPGENPGATEGSLGEPAPRGAKKLPWL